MPPPTVKALLAGKGKASLTQVAVNSPNEALACSQAGIDMVVTWEGNDIKAIRTAAPDAFLTAGLGYGYHARVSDSIKAAFSALRQGSDAVYCPQSLKHIKGLSQEGIPVVGHVGFVPYKRTWTGGFKPVGKTAAEAFSLVEDAQRYQDSGAIAVEIELVPAPVAAIITEQVDMLTIGMGAGGATDAQYLFAEDILGMNTDHIPRHAKVYRNHAEDYARLHTDAVKALGEFREDVTRGAYPAESHTVRMPEDEQKTFLGAFS